MRRFIPILLILAMWVSVAVANHSCPRTGTRETFYLCVTRYEHADPDALTAYWVREAWRQQGCKESPYAALRRGFGFDSVPIKHCGADRAWQWVSMLADDRCRDFQTRLLEERRGPR